MFPHYQALGYSDRLGLALDDLVTWVIVQNLGTAVFSLIAGPLADRYGNRLVLRLVLLLIAAMPVAAIALSYGGAWGAALYPAVFMFIGLTPVAFKTISNYTLEISDYADHPKYLSTLGLCFALPLLASPFLGWIVEATNFESVFFTSSAVVLLGWLMTFSAERAAARVDGRGRRRTARRELVLARPSTKRFSATGKKVQRPWQRGSGVSGEIFKTRKILAVLSWLLCMYYTDRYIRTFDAGSLNRCNEARTDGNNTQQSADSPSC